MKKAIVTGGSKGLGEAVVRHLIKEHYHVWDLSRSGNQELTVTEAYHHVKADLTDLQQGEDIVRSFFDEYAEEGESILIIHNAGTVAPIERVGKMDREAVTQAFTLNTIAPVVLTDEAFRQADKKGVRLTVVNITSGAADKPNQGWSVYGSTKAALNLFTETAALEQGEKGHIVISFSPSVMDTDMQEVIRSSSDEAFAQVERFKALKAEGKLRTADTVGGALVNLLQTHSLQNGNLYHINDLV